MKNREELEPYPSENTVEGWRMTVTRRRWRSFHDLLPPRAPSHRRSTQPWEKEGWKHRFRRRVRPCATASVVRLAHGRLPQAQI